MVCGLTAASPAKEDVLARESLHGNRGRMGMPVNCGDELPHSTEQWVLVTSTRLCLTSATVTGSGHRSVSNYPSSLVALN